MLDRVELYSYYMDDVRSDLRALNIKGIESVIKNGNVLSEGDKWYMTYKKNKIEIVIFDLWLKKRLRREKLLKLERKYDSWNL